MTSIGERKTLSAPAERMFLEVPDVAAELGIKPLDVMRLIAQERLAAVRVNTTAKGRAQTTWKVKREELSKFVTGRVLTDLQVPFWADPVELFGTDKKADNAVNGEFKKGAHEATSDEEVLATAKRQRRSSQGTLHEVKALFFDFSSPPGSFGAALNSPIKGGFADRFTSGPKPALRDAFIRGRLRRAVKDYLARKYGIKDPVALLYSSPEVYAGALKEAAATVSGELLRVSETRIVKELGEQREFGDTITIPVTKWSFFCSYVIEVSSLASISQIERLADTIF